MIKIFDRKTSAKNHPVKIAEFESRDQDTHELVCTAFPERFHYVTRTDPPLCNGLELLSGPCHYVDMSHLVATAWRDLPHGPLLAGAVSAIVAGLWAATANTLTTFIELPAMIINNTRVLRQAQAPGPVTKSFLTPLIWGATLLLPLIAMLGSWCEGVFQGYRIGSRHGVGAALLHSRRSAARFATIGPATVHQTIAEALEDPSKLGLPF